MKVTVDIVCRAIFGGFAGGDAEVAEGATMLDAVVACCEQGGFGPIGNRADHITFMRNDVTVKPDDLVGEGDRIYILHKIMGG